MKQRKILILTSRFGNGHYSVAEALSEHCLEQGNHVTILDVVEVAFPDISDIIYKAFNNIICRNVSLYNFCNSFGRKDSKSNVNHRLMQKIKELSPDQIVITWSGCCKMLGDISIPVTICITDMGLHSGWIYPGAEKYLVASQDLADLLCEHGVERSIIEASGIPVKKAFHHNLKFITSKKKILIMGGGLGIIPWLKDVLDSLATQSSIEVTVVAGRNKKLENYLTQKYPNIRTIGFTNDLHRYLSWADLVLSKPGGVSIFESIYVGTPFVAVYPEYEQEIDNANFVLKNQIGAVVWKGESVKNRIFSIINDNEYLQDCRVACGKLRNSFYQTDKYKDLLRVYSNVV